MLSLTLFYLCFIKSPKNGFSTSPILGMGFVLSFLLPFCFYHLSFSLSRLLYRLGWVGWFLSFPHFLFFHFNKTKTFFFHFFLFSFSKFNAAQSNSIPPQFFCSQSLFIYLVSFFFFAFVFVFTTLFSFAIGL